MIFEIDSSCNYAEATAKDKIVYPPNRTHVEIGKFYINSFVSPTIFWVWGEENNIVNMLDVTAILSEKPSVNFLHLPTDIILGASEVLPSPCFLLQIFARLQLQEDKLKGRLFYPFLRSKISDENWEFLRRWNAGEDFPTKRNSKYYRP